ncbi:MAG: Cdc6/Cdc18 family protein [Candidatus Jordarchaeum sp.]|uniref:Cdc6/Cdc18 family protein n=1 Tax=Candidatus Jordarchaeum sp. TaxID=2823881 RepID=UPI00404A8CB4
MIKSSVFKDESTLFPEYVPPKLPHREKQLDQLMRIYRPLFSDKLVSVNSAVVGQAGLGKTATSKLFGQKIQEMSKQFGSKVLFEYMYCSTVRTLPAVLRQIIMKNWKKIPIMGITGNELIIEINDILKRENTRLIIALDDAKLLGGEAIHGLIRSAEYFGYGNAWVSTLIISRPEDWAAHLYPHLIEDVHSVIEFLRYTESELQEILTYRVSLSFYDGLLSQENSNMVAKIASETGNARHGIEILRHAGYLAEKSGEKRITPEMIRIAKNEVYPETSPEILRGLHRHELITALTTATTLKHEVAVPIHKAYEQYCIICEEYQTTPRSKRNFLNYIRVLADIGLINAVVKNLKRGRRTVITLTDIPASVLEERARKLLEKIGKNTFD